MHVQTFIDAFPDICLQEQYPRQREQWFEQLGDHAQRLLFCHLLKVLWTADFDWDYWSAGAQTLGNDHPTVTRIYEVNPKDAENPKTLFGKELPDLYRKYLAAVRIPEYSIKTEQSYPGWTNRIPRFHKNTLPYRCT